MTSTITPHRQGDITLYKLAYMSCGQRKTPSDFSAIHQLDLGEKAGLIRRMEGPAL